MQLKKFILELRYKESGYPFNYRSDLLRQLTAGEVNKNVDFNEGIEVLVAKKDARIVVEPKRWAVELSTIESIDKTISFAETIFNRVVGAVKWDCEGTRIGVRTLWLNKEEGAFDSFMSTMKDKSLAENTLTKEASDIAISLVFKDEGSIVNYSIGPVSNTELITKYFPSNNKKRELPETALAADIDYALTKERYFTPKFFKEFLARSIKYSETKATQTQSVYQ